ncbi:MAG: xanthine dehydrogenase family protein molybdopterin-binding subunit [Opitutus sp.]|nr:xanthine dehydrogenase family protein molybdopterin-binding subunit [Opitutus sp.]
MKTTSAIAPWNRRRFLQTFGGGLAVLWFLDDAHAQAESGRRGGRGGGGQRRPPELAAWLQIAADGTVTIFTGKAECGQNIRTSLTQVVAEELPAPLAAIKLVMGDTALTPWDAGTFGSRTTPDMAPQLRKVAATAREALVDLAAAAWQVDRVSLLAADGKIVHAASHRSVGFGELTKGEKLLVNVSDSAPTKPATAWKIAGTSLLKINGRDFVTGAHAYASDIARPGMWHGRVLRPAAFEATLVALDASAAAAMPGVKVVHEGNFIAVVALTEHLAAQAIAALRAEWKTTPQISERELFAHLRATARGAPPVTVESAATLRQTYTVAYIAHTPLEPRAAVAEWQGDALTVWTGSQRPFGVRTELAAALHVSEEKIRVIVPDTGSGYGGKHTGEAAVEAARLARAVGRPVKLVWTREEEFTWAYVRPAGVIDLASTATADGLVTAWEHHNYNSGSAGLRAPYEFPGQRTEYHPARSPLKQGSYRALAATANHFARETHLDEQARALRLDPLEFRLKNLRESRARAVLAAAAKRFGWNQTPRAPDRGCGLAYGLDKGGHLATFAEVAIDRATGKVSVVRVVQAFECGAVLNPAHLKNQNEGAIVQGLGAALFEAVRFENGRILNPHFAGYRVPRFSDTPVIDVLLLNRPDLPSAGAGEAPIIGIAPAVGNAIFDATGVRLRSLPLVPNGLKV